MEGPDNSSGVNVVVVRGRVSSEPRRRELPSGGVVTNIEVTTRLDDGSMSVPVVVHDAPVGVVAGDEVVVTGHVARRFFRAGGVTQSRTEVVADRLLKASQRRRADRAIERAMAVLRR